MYRFIFRPLLFLIDPEKAHHFSLYIISLIYKIPKVGYLFRYFFQLEDPRLERIVLLLDEHYMIYEQISDDNQP